MVDTSTEAVTKLLDGVTPGPWNVDPNMGTLSYVRASNSHVVASAAWMYDKQKVPAMDNARFIAAARDLVPALLAERDALRAEVERLKSQPEPIREITDADMANIVAHLSYECEPKGPLPNANSLMMEVVRLRNAIADDKA